MRKENRPKRKRIVEVQSARFAPRAGFPARSILFLELALRAAVYPKSSYPRDNHVVFMWIKPGAGQVCRPAHPAEVGTHVRNRPLNRKMQ